MTGVTLRDQWIPRGDVRGSWPEPVLPSVGYHASHPIHLRGW